MTQRTQRQRGPGHRGHDRAAVRGSPQDCGRRRRETEVEGARTGGATGPVEDDAPKAADPAATERGQHAAPADEQPADESTDTDTDPDMTGPAHEPGERRAEDQP